MNAELHLRKYRCVTFTPEAVKMYNPLLLAAPVGAVCKILILNSLTRDRRGPFANENLSEHQSSSLDFNRPSNPSSYRWSNNCIGVGTSTDNSWIIQIRGKFLNRYLSSWQKRFFGELDIKLWCKKAEWINLDSVRGLMMIYSIWCRIQKRHR